MRILGLINARGGSKGIPGKNWKLLAGRPLIAYSIETGLNSGRIARVIVSTDHVEIADIARKEGADVPFMRPEHLGGDDVLQIDVIRHAIDALAEKGENYDAVCVLQPTSPLRVRDDVDGALSLMERQQADTVITVTDVGGYHPATYYWRKDDGRLEPLMTLPGAGVLRQGLEPIWWRNGAVYAIRCSVIRERRSLYGERIYGYPMPRERSVNIDEPFDWAFAEALLAVRGRAS